MGNDTGQSDLSLLVASIGDRFGSAFRAKLAATSTPPREN
jgi:hypothetical protein